MIKLLDFGEALQTPECSGLLEISFKGSKLYMSPEIKKMNPDNYEKTLLDGYKADIYSLGISMLAVMARLKN